MRPEHHSEQSKYWTKGSRTSCFVVLSTSCAPGDHHGAHYENEEYKNLSFHRESGVLEITLHTNGQSLIFNGHTHEELVQAFYDVGNDRDNRVVILTGAGDAFCKEISAEGFDFFTPEGYDKIFKEGRRMLEHLLNIEVPMIAAINGPFLVHTEFALICDMILASEDAEFQDLPHLAFGIVPGDGVHVLWPEVIGSIRGRYFLMTQQSCRPARR